MEKEKKIGFSNISIGKKKKKTLSNFWLVWIFFEIFDSVAAANVGLDVLF